MIDYRELRVGNWVKKSGSNELKMITVEDFWLYYTDPTRGFYYYEPMLLTPEILEACGFKKWDKNEQVGITRYTKTHSISKDFLIYLYGDGKIEFCIDCDEFSKVLNEVYSLHHLQNLYFSLTGKELTYSPNTTVK